MKEKNDILDVVNGIIRNDKSNNDDDDDISAEEYVKKIYDIYFNNHTSKEYFKEQIKKSFLDAISMISNFSSI